jgi:hypothetical protein
MAEPIREQVIALIMAEVDKVSKLKVERNWSSEITDFPFAAVEDGDEIISRKDSDSTWVMAMEVHIQIFIEDPKPGRELNRLYANVMNEITDDHTLGGKVQEIRFVSFTPDKEDDRGLIESMYGEINFDVEYYVKKGDLHTNPRA